MDLQAEPLQGSITTVALLALLDAVKQNDEPDPGVIA
jgi:hypothetical protein